jgi:hypothetical protein
MTSITVNPDALGMQVAKDWLFATSESKAVAVHRSLKDKLHDNAPRIVGTMKIGMDVSAGLVGDPFLIGYAAFAIIGRLISIIYGTKKHQDKLAAEKAHGKHQHILGHSMGENVRKVAHPREYPVEASAGFSVVAETLGAGYGVEQFVMGASGYTPLLLGLLAIYSYSNILFKREKKKEEAAETKSPEESPSLLFAKSESKRMGIYSRLRTMMKDNPVLVSSMINVVISIGMILGGLFIDGLPRGYIVAGGFGAIANLTQGLLVRKNEYNVEGAKPEQIKKSPATFEDRLTQERKDDPGVELA